MLLIRDHFENLIGLSRSQEICWVVTPSGKVQHGSPAVWAPTSELFFLPTGVRKQLLFSRSVVSNCDPMNCSTLGFLSFTVSWSLLKLMSIESVMPSNHLILCHPLLLLPQSFPPSGSFPMSRLFTSGGQNIRASASVLPIEYSGLISFRID